MSLASSPSNRARQLRQKLAMDGLAPEIGAALLTTSPAAQRWALRHLGQTVGTPMHPQALKMSRQAVGAGVQEFAFLVAEQGCVDPPAASLFERLGQRDIRDRLGSLTPENLLEVVRAGISDQIDQDHLLTTHAGALHVSLERFLKLLHAATQGNRAGQQAAAPQRSGADVRLDDVAPFLFHHLREHFGPTPRRACLTVRAVPPGVDAGLPFVDREASGGVVLRASDHGVYLHPTAFRVMPGEALGTGRATVYAGPLPLHQLVRAYQSTLLRVRMISLGWADPQGPVNWRPPAAPTMSVHFPRAVLERLTPSLGPLLTAPLPQRLEMARTLQVVLAHPAAALKEHARMLNVSPSTLRHHLAPLDPLLQHRDPDSTDLIALAAVLPTLIDLWRAEARDDKRPRRSRTKPGDGTNGSST